MDDLQRIDRAMVETGRDLPPPPTTTGPEPSSTPPARATLHNVPERRQGDTLQTFDLDGAPFMRPAWELCMELGEPHDDGSWCAFLAGPPGTGKTHLAIATMRRAITNGMLAWFWKVPEFIAFLHLQLQHEKSGGLGLTLDQVVANWGAAMGLLVFDDYGAHNPTAWADHELYRIIDARYENRAPTIVTTNVPLNTIDLRVVSRLRSGLVVCEGPDWRAKE